MLLDNDSISKKQVFLFIIKIRIIIKLKENSLHCSAVVTE